MEKKKKIALLFGRLMTALSEMRNVPRLFYCIIKKTKRVQVTQLGWAETKTRDVSSGYGKIRYLVLSLL